jgi:lipopolysaccharide/colanic/teichoic acid biosynthesis glycosyltransferase
MAIDEVHTGRDHDDGPLLQRLNDRGFRLLQGLDLVGLVLVAVFPMWLEFGWDWPDYEAYRYAVSFTYAVLLVLVSVYLAGLYEREPRLGAPSPFPPAVRASLLAVGTHALSNQFGESLIRVGSDSDALWGLFGAGVVGRLLPFPNDNLLLFAALAPLVLVLNRRLVHLDRQRREGPPRLVLVGDEGEVAQAREHIAAVPRQVVVVGAVDDVDDLRGTVVRLDATDVALLSPDALRGLRTTDLAAFEAANVTVLQRVTALETLYGLKRIREVGGLPFVRLRGHGVPPSRRVYKRLVDLLALLVVGIPGLVLSALVAAYLLAVDGRPVLFTQQRVGQGGRLFTLVKFRTMRTDAEEASGAVLSSGEGDPRVLPGAGWLRAVRADELPQLWNILRGEMSLVGPRPERPELTARFERDIPGYARRHELPPGLTGLAQIHGRYHTDAEYKLGYDLQYLVNWSPVLDLEIIVRTIGVILTRRV